MELIDDLGPEELFDADDMVLKADSILDEGITGFMAGAVAVMVSQCHSRGDEFRKSWNLANQIGNEGEKANEEGSVLNPALLSTEKK